MSLRLMVFFIIALGGGACLDTRAIDLGSADADSTGANDATLAETSDAVDADETALAGADTTDDDEVRTPPPLWIILEWQLASGEAPTETRRADLDLHFVHPLATGDGWFDMPFDVFWSNAAPNWGSIKPSVDDNCALVMDDTDGTASEVLECGALERGLCYKVGVHYWDDHTAGAALASVRVYFGETLAHQSTVTLIEKDLWTVATICWPEDAVGFGVSAVCAASCSGDGCPCAPMVTPDYRDPAFFQE